MVGPRVAGLNSTFSQPAAACGMTTGALGLRARAPNGLAVELEYGVSTGTGATADAVDPRRRADAVLTGDQESHFSSNNPLK
jgi:hypothetical protein